MGARGVLNEEYHLFLYLLRSWQSSVTPVARVSLDLVLNAEVSCGF